MVKKIRKRVLSMLVTLAMVISLMPALTLPAKAVNIPAWYGCAVIDFLSSTATSVAGSTDVRDVAIDEISDIFPVIKIDTSGLSNGVPFIVGGIITGLADKLALLGYYYFDGTKYLINENIYIETPSNVTSDFSFTLSGDNVTYIKSNSNSQSEVYLVFAAAGAYASYTFSSAYYVSTNTTPTVTSIVSAGGTAQGGTSQGGSTEGGTKVVITGTGFSGLTGSSAVKFGTTDAMSYNVDSATQITAIAPAGSGSVNVSVTNGTGTSSESVLYTY